jgi:hypothetical protein
VFGSNAFRAAARKSSIAEPAEAGLQNKRARDYLWTITSIVNGRMAVHSRTGWRPACDVQNSDTGLHVCRRSRFWPSLSTRSRLRGFRGSIHRREQGDESERHYCNGQMCGIRRRPKLQCGRKVTKEQIHKITPIAADTLPAHPARRGGQGFP